MDEGKVRQGCVSGGGGTAVSPLVVDPEEEYRLLYEERMGICLEDPWVTEQEAREVAEEQVAWQRAADKLARHAL
jgi:hypothetical protein